MSKYTPTTEDVRDAYQRVWRSDWVEKRGPEFDRWLAEVKAQAWAEGAQQGFMAPRKGAMIANPYKNREN